MRFRGAWLRRGIAAVCFTAPFLGCRSTPGTRPPGQAARPRPIEAPPASTRESEVQEQRWADRNILAPYDANGGRDPACGADGRRFIAASIPQWIGSGPEPSAEEREIGARLVTGGCQDGVVLYFRAHHVFGSDEFPREAIVLYERALSGLGWPNSRYPAGFVRYVASGLARAHKATDEGVGRARRAQQVEIEAFAQSLKDGSYRPDEEALLSTNLLRGTGEEMFERHARRVCLAIEAVEWTSQWLRSFCDGYAHIEEAWTARGNGLANTVTEAGWKGFGEHLSAARLALQRAVELDPRRPEPSALMIAVANGQSPDPLPEALRWFEKATAAQVDYNPAFTRIRAVLQPRWHGTRGDLLAFARRCLATGRFDTWVPFEVFEAVESYRQDLPDGTPTSEVYSDPEWRALLDSMIVGYLAAAEPPCPREFYLSYRALFAHLSGRDSEVLPAMEGHDPVPGPGYRIHDSHWFEKAVLLGEGGAQARRVEGLVAEGRATDAHALLPAVRRRLHHPAGLKRFGDLQQQVDAEATLARGQWADLVPRGPNLGGWTADQGSLRADHRSLLASSNARGYLASHSARVGPDFEIEGRFEVVSSTNGAFQAGPVFGKPVFRFGDWASFRIKKNAGEGGVAYLAKHFAAPAKVTSFTCPGAASFRVRVVGRRVWSWADDAVIDAGSPMPESVALDEDTRVGVGGYQDGNDQVVRFTRLRVRRIPPTSDTAQTRH